MLIYALRDLLLRYILRNVIVKLHVAWATTRLYWTLQQWDTVLFTEELRFHVDFADGRARVLRGRNKLFHPENVIPSDRYGGSSVII